MGLIVPDEKEILASVIFLHCEKFAFTEANWSFLTSPFILVLSSPKLSEKSRKISRDHETEEFPVSFLWTPLCSLKNASSLTPWHYFTRHCCSLIFLLLHLLHCEKEFPSTVMEYNQQLTVFAKDERKDVNLRRN